MDLGVRYWDQEKNRVISVYLTSQFLGHTRAKDLVDKFLSGLSKLDLRNLVQISMDGPRVNWKFYDDYVRSRPAEYPSLLQLGSCGLHIVHGSFKTGAMASGWNLDDALRAAFSLFHDSPARTEDYG